MSKVIVSGSLAPSTIDTPLDARGRVATFAEIANVELPARYMMIVVEDTGRVYQVRKLAPKEIGGIMVENAAIDITDPDALYDMTSAEEVVEEAKTAASEANAAAASANQVVEEYDAKVSEQDSKISELGNKSPLVTDNKVIGDFNIADENDNSIVRFFDGHIETKKFNSETAIKSVEIENDVLILTI